MSINPSHTIPSDLASLLAHRASGPLLRHWADLYKKHRHVKRKLLDPLYFSPALQYISIFNYNSKDDDYTLSLSGEDAYDQALIKRQGRRVSDLYPIDVAKQIIETWNNVRENHKFVIVAKSVSDKPSIRCILPLTNPEGVLSFSIHAYDSLFYDSRITRSPDDYHYSFFSPEDLLNSL